MTRWILGVMLALLACDGEGSNGVDAGRAEPDSALRFRDAHVDAPDTALDASASEADASAPDSTTPDTADVGVLDAAPDTGCVDGALRDTAPCGRNGRGTRAQTCEGGAWVDDECQDPDVCVDTSEDTRPCLGGEQTRRCIDGQWSAWSACPPPECEAGAIERSACGPPDGVPAEETRECIGGLWSEWTDCEVVGDCVPGVIEAVPCLVDGGPGREARTCDAAGRWTDWTACEPTGACFAGVVEWADCEGGSHWRRCGEDERWEAWSACEGPVCPAARTVRVGNTRGTLPPPSPAPGPICGTADRPQSMLAFEAEADGIYTFWLQTEDAVLALREDCADQDSEVACNRYQRVAFEYRPEHALLRETLAGGDQRTLVAQSRHFEDRSWDYTLHVAHRSEDRCDDEPLDNHHWSRAATRAELREGLGYAGGLLSLNQCADRADWLAVDVPMGCQIGISPLSTQLGFSQVLVRGPNGAISRPDRGLGPYARARDVQLPGTWRVAVEPVERGAGEPQTLIDQWSSCGQLWQGDCDGSPDPNGGNDDPERATALRARAVSETVCPGDLDHFVWDTQPGCRSRAVLACPADRLAEIEYTLTDADGEPLPADSTRAEPGLGPLHAGVVVYRPTGAGTTHLRLRLNDGAEGARCDLRVDQFCMPEPECAGADPGVAVGDYGAAVRKVCRGENRSTVEIPAGCTLRAELLDQRPAEAAVGLTLRDSEGGVLVDGDSEVELTVDAATTVDLVFASEAPSAIFFDFALHCP